MVRLLDYANAVAPSLKAQPRLLPELSDSLVVLAVTRLDAFFRSLVSLGARAREQQIRKHFQKHGSKDARTCAVFGVFWAAGAVLLVALFNNGQGPNRPVGMIVSSTGVILSLVWTLLQLRAIGYLHFYDAIVEEIETRLSIDPDIAVSARINTRLHSANVRGVSVRPLMVGCAVAAGLSWAVAWLWFYFQWSSPFRGA
jgi:hypothetical protein